MYCVLPLVEPSDPSRIPSLTSHLSKGSLTKEDCDTKSMSTNENESSACQSLFEVIFFCFLCLDRLVAFGCTLQFYSHCPFVLE